MMDLLKEYIIPSLIILLANVFSDKYGGPRYEIVTAIFGWSFCIFFPIFIILAVASGFFSSTILNQIQDVLLQLSVFSLVTALSRDYEKILKPVADRFFQKKKSDKN